MKARAETLCPFCGLRLALVDDGVIHLLPLCKQFRDNDPAAFLDLAVARVQLQARNERARG
jgi:hypothetical protein